MSYFFRISLLLLFTGFVALSCQRSTLEAADQSRLLTVGRVSLVTGSDWTSTADSSASRATEHQVIDLENNLQVSAEQGWIGDLSHEDLSDTARAQQHVDFVSKGTPITSVSNLTAFKINLFNSGTADWSTNTPLTESLTATLNGTIYSLNKSYDWSSITDKVSLLAYAPVEDAGNGLTLAASGRTIDYVVPTDVTKHPDFCVASPEQNVINVNGKQQFRNFVLNHQLTAVGVAIHGWNVKVTKVEITGIICSGTYDLIASGWSSTGSNDQTRTMGIDPSKVPTDSYGNGNKNWTNATAADGYMMMIPQSLFLAAQMSVSYEGVNGNTDKGTISGISLKSLTGGVWKAGAKVTYNIQLKMAPGTSTTTYTMPWKAGYSGSTALAWGVHDPKDTYTFSWSDSWLKVHNGTIKVNDNTGGASAPWSTAVGGIKGVWFFTPENNNSTSSSRTTTVTVTGKRTAPRAVTVTQAMKPSITAAPTATVDNPIPFTGKAYTFRVVSNYPWKVTSPAGGLTFNPTSGTATTGQNVVVTVPANTGASREVRAKFETTNDGGVADLIASAEWKGTQKSNFSIDKTGPGETIPGGGKAYTVKVTGIWTCVPGTGVTVSPTSGSGSTTVTITVAENPSMTATREVKVDFKDGTAVMATWSGTQVALDYVTVGSLKWATGNLVAAGENSCKIGKPTDYGLYFNFGSLVGWSGGANGDGTGTGSPGLAVKVKPAGYNATSGNAWPAGYYKGGTTGTQGCDLPADAPTTGIGDPCRYYLGGTWRTPAASEWLTLLGANGANTPKGLPLTVNNTALSFPASGYRHFSNGTLLYVGSNGYYGSSSVYNATDCYRLYFGSGDVAPQDYSDRSNGMLVRCVSGTYVPPGVNPPVASDYVTVGRLKWTKGNLVAKNGNECKVGAPTDYGVYFHFGSLVGWSGGANGDGTGTGSSVALAVQVKPSGYSGSTSWPAGYYTGGTAGTGYGLPADAPTTGIGDPCRYYLGAPWRTPTAEEWPTLLGADGGNTPKKVPLTVNNTALSFPASGYRLGSGGAFANVSSGGRYWSSSVYTAGGGIFYLHFNSGSVYPQYIDPRSLGMSVRCVAPL